MMIQKETLELVQKTAQEAQAAVILPDLDEDGRKAFVSQGGVIKTFEMPPPLRRHNVGTLTDLIAYALNADNKAPVVWHDREAVVLLPDDADRRDCVTFPLTYSERFEVLRRLAGDRSPLSQQQLCRLLRRDLGVAAPIVQQFRKLDWKQGTGGTSEVNPQNMRVSKQLLAEVAGVAELPEEMVIETPVYAQTGERDLYQIRCYLDVDAQNQAFGFGPLPDELPRLIDLAQASIRSRLDAVLSGTTDRKAIPVYYGTP